MPTLVFAIKTKPIEKALKGLGFGIGEAVQKQVDESVLKYCEPYLPFDRGILRDSGYTATVIGSGKVIWDTPYARYQYYGKLMVDPVYRVGAFYNPNYGFWSRRGVQKELTEKPLNYHGGGLRGSHWASRMWADRKRDIINEAKAVVGRGTHG